MKDTHDEHEPNLSDAQSHLKDQITALNIASIVAETDLSGRIIYANDAFCKMSKYSREELLGQTHKIINSGYHDKEFFGNLWKTIQAGKIWKDQIQNKAKDGSLYWVDTTIVPFKNAEEKIYKYVAIRHDITEMKVLQNKLTYQMELVEKYLNSSSSKTKALEELSHDIRNSLNHVVIGMHFLKDEIKDEGKRELLISPIEKSVNYMVGLLGDIMEGSRLEANKTGLIIDACPIRSTLEEVKNMFSLSAKVKGLSIEVQYDEDLPDSIYCDRYRLIQLLQNFLTNAIKFTSEGEITIGAKKISLKSNQVEISFYVQDRGRGISTEEKKQLFKEFEQISSSDSRIGTGIGLMICKKLAELMNGEIVVESEKGEGSVFALEAGFRVV